MKALAMGMVILLVGCITLAQETELGILSAAPSLDVQGHKLFDVIVYKTIIDSSNTCPNPESPNDPKSPLPAQQDRLPPPLPAYAVAFFRNEGDSLRRYQAFYGSNEFFDRAFYVWESDTTVAIRLHNTKDKKSVSFKVFGYGTTTGME